MALRRLTSQQLQKDSFLAIESIVNNMNCEFRRLEPDNAGIDGEIDLVKSTEYVGKIIKCQIKAGLSYISSETENYIKVRIERKYLELWNKMNFPVILFFFNPNTKSVYWKSIQNYLKINQDILKKQSKYGIISFKKSTDIFTSKTYDKLMLIVENRFEYNKIIVLNTEQEQIISNWFPVKQLPKIVYIAPTNYRDKRQIIKNLKGYYSFILKSKEIYSFSDLTNQECELRNFCEYNELNKTSIEDIEEKYFIELLNRTIQIFALKNDLLFDGERFFFSREVLKNTSLSKFKQKSLAGKRTERKKIYIKRNGSNIEYKHSAVKLDIFRSDSNWFLQIEPDWFFSYRKNPYKSKKELGIRITIEKAKMYNKDYLYLLHFWKSFLSNNSDVIIFNCDNFANSQKIIIDTKNLSFSANFILFNDYMKKKKFNNEN